MPGWTAAVDRPTNGMEVTVATAEHVSALSPARAMARLGMAGPSAWSRPPRPQNAAVSTTTVHISDILILVTVTGPMNNYLGLAVWRGIFWGGRRVGREAVYILYKYLTLNVWAMKRKRGVKDK